MLSLEWRLPNSLKIGRRTGSDAEMIPTQTSTMDQIAPSTSDPCIHIRFYPAVSISVRRILTWRIIKADGMYLEMVSRK